MATNPCEAASIVEELAEFEELPEFLDEPPPMFRYGFASSFACGIPMDLP